ncbi:MAG TPA: hypothetical protein DCM08_09660 [Microscillaceae bacterium]|jgi:hypothetical protein|nr:hypothetical protein [Microscillaceae bacterium]
MHPIQKFFVKNTVAFTLKMLAFVARRPKWRKLSDWLTTTLANSTIRSKRIRQATDLQQLGEQWQRGFPSKKQVPISHIDERTVYAEIHTPCPLRGTGDTHACYAMMRYDREIVKKAGGVFVVLQSQATPGQTFCKVAMRFQQADVSDLVSAHLQK